MTSQKQTPLPPPTNLEKLARWRRDVRLNERTERWFPFVVALAASLAYAVWWRDYRVPDDGAKDLLGAAISIGSIAVGFLGTMKALLFSIQDKPVVQQLKQTGRYRDLVDYLLWGIAASSFLAIVSAAGLVVSLDGRPRLHATGVSVWLFAATAAVLTYWRILRLFAKILKAD